MTRTILIGCLITMAQGIAAQGPENDTLRVMNTLIYPGDTAAVYIYIANHETLGGYSMRLEFDTSLLGVVTMAEDERDVEAVQLRGELGIFAFGTTEPGVVTGITSTLTPPAGLDPGSGNTIQLFFRAHEYAPPEAVTEIAFVDDPLDSNRVNWFTPPSGLYQYRPVRVAGKITIGSQESIAIQNRPNPFRSGEGNTYFDFDLPRAGRVNLSIYDVVGRRLKTLVDGLVPAGHYEQPWDGRDADGRYVPSGIYLYRLEFDNRTVLKKMAVLR